MLLVEDEPTFREALAELLEHAGFDVTATCTGDEAAILLAEQDFAVLLTDITMPGHIDGIGLAEHAREAHPGLPVVFVSGAPDSEARTHAIAPPTAFLSKPCTVDRLLDAVERMAASARAYPAPIPRRT